MPAPGEHPPALPAPRPRGRHGLGGAGRAASPSGPADDHPAQSTALAVLAGRIAATLASHEPGWQLPRVSELARRHHVGLDEARAAVDQLIARQLVRCSADGRLYRASPAEYLVSVDGLAGMSAVVDPMGRDLTCLSYGMASQAAPESTARALGVPPGTQLSVVRLAWAVDGVPGALSTTYVAGYAGPARSLDAWITQTADRGVLPLAAPAGELPDRDGPQGPAAPGHLRTVSVELGLPPASIGGRLRLRPGQLAILVTVVTGTDPGTGPAALTTTVLRPDMFSVSLTTAPGAGTGAGSPDGGWPLAPTEYPW